MLDAAQGRHFPLDFTKDPLRAFERGSLAGAEIHVELVRVVVRHEVDRQHLPDRKRHQGADDGRDDDLPPMTQRVGQQAPVRGIDVAEEARLFAVPGASGEPVPEQSRAEHRCQGERDEDRDQDGECDREAEVVQKTADDALRKPRAGK